MGCAAVIVSYRSAEHLLPCLTGLHAPGTPIDDVVVVDNASRDDTPEIAARAGARVVRNGSNIGFGRAANQGVAETTGTWVLVLNPDTVVTPEALGRLLETAEKDPTVACVGPKLCDSTGTPYPTGRRFPSLVAGALHALLSNVWPTNPATRYYHLADAPRTAPTVVDWVSGACMLLRREAFLAVGGFDPRYFMYVEDMDLCLRLARAGWRIVLDPGAEIEHAVAGSSRSTPYRKIWAHHASMIRFYRVRFEGDPRAALFPAAAGFLLARAGLSLAVTWVRRRNGRSQAVR